MKYLKDMTFDEFASALADKLNLTQNKSGKKIRRKEAAQMLGVSIQLIDKMIRNGKLKKKKVGSVALLDYDEVNSLLN